MEEAYIGDLVRQLRNRSAQEQSAYNNRQAIIDNALTPTTVRKIALEHEQEVCAVLQEGRCVDFIFASTHALMRRATGTGNDKPTITGCAVEAALKQQPDSKTLKLCAEDENLIVIRILTHLPLSILGGKDQVLTHTVTAFKRHVFAK